MTRNPHSPSPQKLIFELDKTLCLLVPLFVLKEIRMKKVFLSPAAIAQKEINDKKSCFCTIQYVLTHVPIFMRTFVCVSTSTNNVLGSSGAY